MAVPTQRFRVEVDDILCTCGVQLRKHKGGRCVDAILHRLLYGEIPERCAVGTIYTDGVRDLSLFQEDLLVSRGDDKYLVPHYSSNPNEAMILLSKWHDMGGTGSVHMNRSGWSANFNHGIARRACFHGSGYMIRSRLEWMPARALAPVVIEFKRRAQSDECTWIDGVNPVEPDPNAQS